jgi:hypothetical protein
VRSERTFLCLALLSLLLPLAAWAQDSRIVIEQVIPGSPAERAGLEAGDGLLRFGGAEIHDAQGLQAVIGAHEAGDTVEVVVERAGEAKTLSLTLGERPDGGPSVGVMLAIGAPVRVDTSTYMPAADRKRVLLEIAQHLRDGYIYEDKGNALADRVEQAAETDRFRTASTLKDFVEDVNPFLLEISNDKHLRVGYRADDEGAGGPMVRRVVRGPGGPHGPGESPDADGGPAGDFGVRGARILDGNVGYLDLGMFAGSEAAKPAIDEAMLSLEQADALIIDLRHNGGGAPWMVRYLSGFLFAEPTHLASTWARGMSEPAERWTLDGQPTRAFADKPVFVLTSGRTFSAAESFTFGLKINDRVRTVGERTGGGGHFGDDVPLGEALRLFLPGGRTYDPKTGEGWEAEGIAPDLPVPAAQALDKAVEEARRAIAARG